MALGANFTTFSNTQANTKALARPRLFAQLNHFQDKAATWIVAAGGYGKTTLAVSYAASQNKPLIWLLIPEAGMSAGEFFFKLRQETIRSVGKAASQLPIFSPEYSASSATFVRQFAELFANCVNYDAILLLDDLHHVAAKDPLQPLIALFAQELDGKVQTLIASRHEPAPPWIKLRSRGKLAFIDENQLAFSLEESTELLTQQGLPQQKLARLLPQIDAMVGGWAVALMLLLEHWQRTTSLPDNLRQDLSLDDWFLHEIYLPLTSKDKQVLRYCSQPSLIPEACVNAATDIKDAHKRLAKLAQEHAFIFIAPSTGGGRHYRFHDLFKDFLRRQFQQEDPKEQQNAIIDAWATSLWQEGFWDLAAPLLIKQKNWEALATGINHIALDLLHSGRGDKLYSLLAAIPEPIRRTKAHLRLWEGICLTLINTSAARELMSSAWEELSQTEDYVHLAIAWSGIVDSIWLEWAHVSLYERWIAEFERFETVFREHLPLPLWHAVLRGIVTAISYGRPLDPSLQDWEREAIAALSCNSMADSERVMLASQLMYLNTWQFGRRAGASRIMAIMENQQEVIQRSSPLAQCLWKTFTALWAFLFEADAATCFQEAEIGRDLIRNYGIGTWDDAVPAVHCALAFNNAAAMNEWVAWFMRTEPKTHRPFYDTFQAHFLSAQAWVNNERSAALAHAKEAVAVADKHGSIAISALFRGIYAGLLAENGLFTEALLMAREARHQQHGFGSDFLNIGLYLNLAKIPLYRGQPQRALPYLRLAFAAGERQRLFFPIFINNEDLSHMCGLILKEDPNNAYALWHIKARKLAPPSMATLQQHWPWHTTINVLGRFVLLAQDQSTQPLPGGKQGTSKLLSHLIAAGPNGISQETLARTIWPDSEPENALNSLYVGLHRLRKNLFKEPKAILNEEGRTRFNPHLVQVDAWQLQTLSTRAKTLSSTALSQALELYQGEAHLPGMEEVEADIWRLKISSAYENIATEYAQRLEPTDPREALSVYQKALEQVPLSTSLWCGVLRCESMLGNQQAIHQHYTLLSQRFEQELDMAPPATLSELYQSLVKP